METMDLLLVNRRFMYAVLARAFCEEPDTLLLKILAGDHMSDEVSLLKEEGWKEGIDLLRSLRGYVDDDGSLRSLRGEYTKLFVGPQTLLAPPWESVHITGKRVLFLPEVLDVREAYREAGFLPARFPVVSDDHIGLELDFMEKLAQEAYEAWQARRSDECAKRLCQAESFLKTHLLCWIDDLAQSILTNYGESFYGKMTAFASSFMKHDLETIEGIRAVAFPELSDSSC